MHLQLECNLDALEYERASSLALHANMLLVWQDFMNRIKAQGQRWVPILDPNIHIRKGYAPYDSGIKQDIFMKDVSGKPYVGQVSFTCAHYPEGPCFAAHLLHACRQCKNAFFSHDKAMCFAALAWSVPLA